MSFSHSARTKTTTTSNYYTSYTSLFNMTPRMRWGFKCRRGSLEMCQMCLTHGFGAHLHVWISRPATSYSSLEGTAA